MIAYRTSFHFLIVAALLACCALPVAARDVDGLYAARVAVADRSPTELSRATRAALAEVLTKLTGDRRQAHTGAAANLLGQASRLVLQYGYESAPAGGLLLAAEFDERAVRAALAERGVPVWGKERPETLAWIVLDSAVGPDIAAGDRPSRGGQAALAAAARRGIPLLLPLVDIEETSRLGAATAGEVVLDTALELATPYATPAAFVAYLREAAPGQWQGDFRTRVEDAATTWVDTAASPEELVEQAVDRLADELAARYADPGQLARAETLALTIAGVASAADYARVMRYLGALDTVSGLFVTALEDDRMDVRVQARGGRAGFAQSVAFGRVLAPISGQVDRYRVLE